MLKPGAFGSLICAASFEGLFSRLPWGFPSSEALNPIDSEI